MASKDELRRYIETMPSLGASAQKILIICNDPNTSAADLNHVVSLDPVLAARILRLVNSAFYRQGQPVTSIPRALVMLGMNTVKNLALSTAMMSFFTNRAGHSPRPSLKPGLSIEGLWRHSLGTAIIAKDLAKKRGVDTMQGEEYFTAGLLHDLGKVVLSEVLGSEYQRCTVLSDQEGRALFEIEGELLGISHCEAGALILEDWKLEGPIGEVIRSHHEVEAIQGKRGDLLLCVAAADHLANFLRIGFSGHREGERLAPEVWETLGLNEDEGLEEIEEHVSFEIEEAEIFLKIGVR